MKKTIFIILAIGLASALAAYSQAVAPHIKLLMDALEERHNAVEESYETSFELMNAYHQQMMAVEGVQFYSGADWDESRYPLVRVKKEVERGFDKPKYEFNLSLQLDYSDSVEPVVIYYKIETEDDESSGATAEERTAANKKQADDSKQAQIDSAQAILDNYRKDDNGNDITYDDEYPNGYREAGSSIVRDPEAYGKAYWEWWVVARKKWIEEGVKVAAFNRDRSDFISDPGHSRKAKDVTNTERTT